MTFNIGTVHHFTTSEEATTEGILRTVKRTPRKPPVIHWTQGLGL